MVETSRAQVAVEPGWLVLPHVYAEVPPSLVHLPAQVAPVLPRLTVRRHVLPQRPLTAELLQAHAALVRFLACGDFFVKSFGGFLLGVTPMYEVSIGQICLVDFYFINRKLAILTFILFSK